MMNSEVFRNEVDLKYKLYNSIFLTLPLDGIHGTGILIPILHNECQTGYETGKSPAEILDIFFRKHTSFQTEKEQIDFLFRVIQYIERQVVLLDAVEDAAFEKLNDLNGTGSMKSLMERVKREKKEKELRQILGENFSVRIVLTAHPTQFYPATVLSIIHDLIGAIRNNDLVLIRTLLTQLGKTPFFSKEPPTPFDEAQNLSWYLEHIFYPSVSELVDNLYRQTGSEETTPFQKQLVSFGFWPGGDRDGNPFVTVDITLKVAGLLRNTILNLYLSDLKNLRRRLTFKGIYENIQRLETALENSISEPDPEKRISLENFWESLIQINEKLSVDFDPYFQNLVYGFMNKVRLFGFHFGKIDIRQDSRVIKSALKQLLDEQKAKKEDFSTGNLDAIFDYRGLKHDFHAVDSVIQDTYNSFRIIREIQRQNGEPACNRYIISNCRSAEDVANVFALAHACGWEENIPLDIIPLFETIEDLEKASSTMQQLYEQPAYRKHLEQRRLKQTIMLGFSDGTKDGGYFAANWNIYKAKENLTRLSRASGIEVIFFDGRGGPPARGGGNTHNFYASLGSSIESREIQVTIQGQTISSKFGTLASAGYYTERLLTAGLENLVFSDKEKQLTDEGRMILELLAKYSMEEYRRFRHSEKFLPYLEKMSVIKYYSLANIASRPSKRKTSEQLNFEDLRAIPFVGAWSQMKQNVPGFFGVGFSLKRMEEEGLLDGCKRLFKESLFFRTMVENSMQSLRKSYFPLTDYMEKDPEFGVFRKWIQQEFLLSTEMLLKISGFDELMENLPSLKDSIALRASIVLPLITIQQYAMIRLRQLEAEENTSSAEYLSYQKLVIRSLFGNINASRNSA